MNNMKTFIDAFLVAGPSEVLFHDDETDSDQMRYEKELRARVVRRDVENPKRFRGLDTPSLCGRPWHYYYAYGNVFVDYSSFYSVLTVISLDACTIVHSERRCEKTFVLWTYAAATVWCNCQKVAEIDVPVYKPMIKRTFTVPLVQGDNELYVFVQNLGVRDSRTLFGIEVADSEGLSCMFRNTREGRGIRRRSIGSRPYGWRGEACRSLRPLQRGRDSAMIRIPLTMPW